MLYYIYIYVIFYHSKTIGFFCAFDVRCRLLYFHEFEVTAEGQERMKMMFSKKDH